MIAPLSSSLVVLSALLSVSAGACVRNYTIQAGDICNSIGAANNVSTYQLQTINYPKVDSACSNLVIGDNICLGYQGEDCSTTYVVGADDTCEVIANNHRLNTTILFLNNPQIHTSCDNIYTGEVLCVSSTVQAPPSSGVDFDSDSDSAPSASSTAQAVSATSDTSDSGDDGDDDDDDLPFCDEL
ncbi:hypothetical protein C8J56DRAFT_390590 [Mycena floridula]|nr:hypothetical protein C8J56DRAFT_390590 [Mycena floridula]